MSRHAVIFTLSLAFMGFLMSYAKAEDFYAYYTKIDSGQDFEKISRTGSYADIVVQVAGGKFVFHRSSSYLPYWQTNEGKWYVEDIMRRNGDGTKRMPDRTNTFSHVKVVEQDEQKVVVHWRHLLEFAAGNPHFGVQLDNFVDEYFTIHSNGKVERKFRKATGKIDNWLVGSNEIMQTFELRLDGIKNVKTKRGKGQANAERVKGNPVKGKAVTKAAAVWKFDEGIGDLTNEGVTGRECEITGHKSLWKKGVSGTCLQFDGYTSQVSLPASKAPKISDQITLEAWVVLVFCYSSIDGYSFFSFIRASSVVNRQFTFASAALRIVCQAATSSFNFSMLSILRDKHCRAKIPSSISAISSQLPCLGV